MQLELMGFTEFFEDRVFSGMDLPQTKPAPDVYLAAANALRCPPDSMAVIEDSVAGVTAGVAAGATVFAYSPEARKYGPDRELIAAGATTVFRSMNELPQILIAFQKSR